MQKWSDSKDTQRICRLKREVPQASWRPVAGTETAGPTGQGDPFARCRIQRLLSVTWCTRESCFLYPNTKYSLSKDSPYSQLCVIMKWGFRYRFAFLVGLVALTFAGGAFAQSSDQPEPVPRELAAALIGSGFGGESTDFFVGTLPSGLPDDFTLPEGAQVLGGGVDRWLWVPTESFWVVLTAGAADHRCGRPLAVQFREGEARQYACRSGMEPNDFCALKSASLPATPVFLYSPVLPRGHGPPSLYI